MPNTRPSKRPAKRAATRPAKRPAKRAVAPHLVEPELKYVTDATFAEWHNAISRGFQEAPRPEMRDFDRPFFENKRSFGFKVGRRWVSTCGAFSRRMTVPGGADVPVAAVTVVTVHPPYRRRGLLTKMMRHQLEDVARRGEPLAALWASESHIYGRFGYGAATTRAVIKGTSRRLDFLRGVAATGSVDEVTRDQWLAVVPGMHATLRAERPGTLLREGDVWKWSTFDKEFARGGASELRFLLHYDAAGDVDGFATYRFKEDWEGTEPSGEVRVGELWAEDPGAHAGLWRYLLDIDLSRKFRWRNAPTDELLKLLVADHRAVETELLDNIYVRIVDVEAALRARQYAAGVELVIEVDDPILPANSGCYRLQTDGSPDGSAAEVTRVETKPDISLGILELGTIYLGGVPLTNLHRAGRVTEHTPGAVSAASTAFGWHRAPWCPDMF